MFSFFFITNTDADTNTLLNHSSVVASTNTTQSQPMPLTRTQQTADSRNGVGLTHTAAAHYFHSSTSPVAMSVSAMSANGSAAHTQRSTTVYDPQSTLPSSHTVGDSMIDEQLHSRHGNEHIAVVSSVHNQQSFGLSGNNFNLKIGQTSSDSTAIAPTTTVSTAKCSIVGQNKCATKAKIVLQKYFPNKSVNEEVNNSSVLSDVEQSKSLNASNLSVEENCISEEATTKTTRNSPNWFPSKRNSLNLLASKAIQVQQKQQQQQKSKMVAMQEVSNGDADNLTFDDPSEELQYGPGIVSKLRCRYLSLALRQTATKQRPTLDNLRRATSLNNLLDEDDDELDVDEVDDDSGRDSNGHTNSYDDTDKSAWHMNDTNASNRGRSFNGIVNKMTTTSTKMSTAFGQLNGKGAMTFGKSKFNGNHFNGDQNRDGIQRGMENAKPPIGPSATNGKMYDAPRRQVQRGNDSLKRARSVEALMRYDTLAWRRDQMNDSEEYPSSNPIILDELIVTESTMIKTKTPQDITIEDKIQQARERNSYTKTPKRLTSFMDDTERPPPDLVKQTLLKFEASVNRRPRGNLQRYGNGDVASKVATYKSKLSAPEKPQSQMTMTTMAPLSPTPAAILTTTTVTSATATAVGAPPPSITSLANKKPAIKPRTTSPKPIVLNIVNNNKTSAVDIYQIRNSLDHRTTTSPAATQPKFSPFTLTNGNPMAYRNNKQDSPISPESPQPRVTATAIDTMSKKPIAEVSSIGYDSPTIAQLTRHTENLTISTPKARPIGTRQNNGDSGGSSDNGIDIDSDGEDESSTSSESVNGCTGSYDVNAIDVSDNDSENGDKKCAINKKRVSKSALENISMAGQTTKFSFDSIGSNGGGNVMCGIPNKSHLPVINSVNLRTMKSVSNNTSVETTTTTPPEPSVRQIGIIRPLVSEMSKPPAPMARSENLLITNLLSSQQSSAQQNSISPALSPIARDCHGNSATINNSIVQQKNLINKEKNGEDAINGKLSINGSSSSLTIQLPIKWTATTKSQTVCSLSSSTTSMITSSPIAGNQQSILATHSPQVTVTATMDTATVAAASKMRSTNDAQSNTMVFNFSNRKEVPDYIENDGLVIRRKRELPKVRFLIVFSRFDFFCFVIVCICFDANLCRCTNKAKKRRKQK